MKLDTYRHREQDVSEGTINSRMSALNRFEDFIGDKEPEVEDVEEWVDHLIHKHEDGEIKSSTIREYFKAVRYYFEKVKGEFGALEHIPRRFPTKDVDHGEYLTPEEWEHLRSEVYNRRNRCILEMMYWYARRPGEARLINLEDIDFEEKTISFNILKKKKDDRGELLPWLKLKRYGEVYDKHRVYKATFELHPDVEVQIESVLEHHDRRKETVVYNGEEKEVTPLFSAHNARMSYDAIWAAVKKETSRAGIDKNITPKSKRHSRATHLQWSGVPSDVIAEQQLAHNPETDVIGAYVHPKDEEQVREILTVRGSDEE